MKKSKKAEGKEFFSHVKHGMGKNLKKHNYGNESKKIKKIKRTA